jgi:choice-of-anchor A domain-containing protein
MRHAAPALAYVLLLSSAAVSHAGVIDLGTQAGNANVFTLGDFKAQNSDVEGAVVSGGSIQVSSYSINQNNADAFGASGYAAAARNDIKLSNGSIKNGLAYAGGAIKLSSADGPAASSGNPIDFDAASAYYLSLSADLAKVKATGAVTDQYSAALVTGGGGGVLDVFNVSGDFFKTASNWQLSGLTAGQTLIFNIGGSAGGFRPWGISFEPLKNYNVLFNFYEADTLDVRGIIGSVLAPKAAVNSQWGVVKGSLVVGSWDSTTQVDASNYFRPVELSGFRDPAPAPIKQGEVPEPGTLGLALAGFGVAAWSRRRARRTV